MLTVKFNISLFFIVLSNLAFAGDKVVSVITLEDNAPIIFTEKSTKGGINELLSPGQNSETLKGYSWDILRESYHKMGYTIHLSTAPWRRAIESVKAGKVDILFPTGKNTARHQYFLYSKAAINTVSFVVYINKDSKIKWQNISSLQGLKVGLYRGYNYGDKWEQEADVIKINLDNISQGFKMLKSNRIDAFVGYEVAWNYALRQMNMTTEFKVLPKFDFSTEHVAVLKTNARALQLLSDFDNGKQKLIQSGQLKEINKRWYIDQ
jgi:polar amino acid transport system substrate-binding protein